MRNAFARSLTLLLLFLLLMNESVAATTVRDLVTDYRYSMTVEWDQQDQAFARNAEQKLIIGIEGLIRSGARPADMVREVLSLMPDLKMRAQIEEALNLYEDGKISGDKFFTLLDQYQSHLSPRGASWSTLAKVAFGMVIGYAVLKALVLVVMYWDTDPNYGQTGDGPPKLF